MSCDIRTTDIYKLKFDYDPQDAKPDPNQPSRSLN